MKKTINGTQFCRMVIHASALTAALRPGHEEQRTPENLSSLFAAVQTEYRAVLTAAAQL